MMEALWLTISFAMAGQFPATQTLTRQTTPAYAADSPEATILKEVVRPKSR
jgi:hypothetical protein